jgi:short-subunit dehydrogenase
LVSSTVGWNIWPGITLYSATKAFTTYLTGILYFSNKFNLNLDIQGYCPMGVSTNILEQMKNPIIFISSKMACMSSLSELAMYSKTFSFVYKNIWTTGHYYHELQVTFIAFLGKVFPNL